MPMPKISIGLDAASRAKYKSSLAAQLSFFSITQTDDPIPRTNFSFSVYYVLGALAALLYALLDPSCVDVTLKSVRVSNMIHWDHGAPVVQIFWPLTR